MKKASVQVAILLVFGFVIYDFVSSSKEEQAIIEEASNPTQVMDEEAVDIPEEYQDLTDEELDALLEEAGGAINNNGSEVQFGASKGDTAYDFYLEDMDGNFVSLSDFRGKKVFLNFWASWCPPCRVEMPHLQEFAEENEDVVVLGVNVTSSESSLDNVKGFVDEFGLTFPNLYGTDDIANLYDVEFLPTSYFIDSNGVVNESVIGPVTKDILEARFALMDQNKTKT